MPKAQAFSECQSGVVLLKPKAGTETNLRSPQQKNV